MPRHQPTARSALWLPLFDEFADTLVCARLAAEAEEEGWQGFFVWDHLRWEAPVRLTADPWITLAAIAAATEQLRLGPMVTPLPRRRPAKVASETTTLDQLSRGRLVLGVGIGSDRFGELSKTGEPLDDQVRGQMLDESLEILAADWSGEPVRHRGDHYTVDGIRFLPRPVQQPGVPVWVTGFPGNIRPLRQAARHDGFVPVNLQHPDELAEIAAALKTAPRRDRVVRHRPGPPDRRRSRALHRGGRHVVAPRVRARGAVAGRRAGRSPSRAVRTLSMPSLRHTDFYDAELHRYNVLFRAAAAVRGDDHVLDVGCGTGQTTREAARAAFNGSAVGVDISAAMLERARRLSDAEGTRNVTYEAGDAQTHPFPAARFDLCISRFGTMFFTDAVAAFANIGRALRPDARLVLLV